jgi:hypothetical protein
MIRELRAGDADWPLVLDQLAAAAPAMLHVRGARTLAELCAEPAVAVVGARRGSRPGEEFAYALSRGLAAAGVAVVSGLALGIDAAVPNQASVVGRRDGECRTVITRIAPPARKPIRHERVALFERCSPRDRNPDALDAAHARGVTKQRERIRPARKSQRNEAALQGPLRGDPSRHRSTLAASARPFVGYGA